MKILNFIKHIFFSTHGSFLIKKPIVYDELSDLYKEIYGNYNMRQIQDDKINLRKDSEQIKRSFKKSFNSYKHVVS